MLRIFCATAESSSFKDAAVRLGVSPQTVTRAIKALEHVVGEPLFYRNTRHMRITDFGEQLAQRAREGLVEIERLFQRRDAQPENDIAGTVRITAPTAIGRRFLLDALSAIAREFPRIRLDLRLSDSITDVIAQQIDIGVRIGFLRDSGFVARSTAKLTFASVAAPELIARCGVPKDMYALAVMPTVALVDGSSGRIWPWYFGEGQQCIPTNRVFLTDDPETELDMVLRGVGFGQIADCLARPYIEQGRLISVLDELAPKPWDIYVYRPQQGPVPRRVRVVYDRIVQALQQGAT